MRTTQTASHHITAAFDRPDHGPCWTPEDAVDLPTSGLCGWQSNGGAARGHKARALPYTLDIPIPSGEGALRRVLLVGIFALHAERASESPGTLGATLQFINEHGCEFRLDLLNGRHYSDARSCAPLSRHMGDGTSVTTVGSCECDGCARVDLLTVDVPPGVNAQTLLFKDLGSPASFVIFDVVFEFERAPGCPFSAKSGGVPLVELASIVRVGDRVKFAKATQQLEHAIETAEDLDEARGEALTFLAVLTAATLELGGSRSMHRLQLEAAREMDRADDTEQILAIAARRVEALAQTVFAQSEGPSSHKIDRALALVERNYARNITDETISEQLGLSTSHFRYLFRQATGQPFHRYLIALRLEKARRMLLDQDLPVSQVAEAVGFTAMSHFSRAFSQRFSVSPTNIRRAGV